MIYLRVDGWSQELKSKAKMQLMPNPMIPNTVMRTESKSVGPSSTVQNRLFDWATFGLTFLFHQNVLSIQKGDQAEMIAL